MTKLLAFLFLFASVPASAASRYPQPVRAGDLIGRDLLAPQESQPVLGHVEGVERAAGGDIALLVRTWSWLPWGGRTVAVPASAVALLGEHVALMDLSPQQLAALPNATPAPAVLPDQQIEIGVVRPFH